MGSDTGEGEGGQGRTPVYTIPHALRIGIEIPRFEDARSGDDAQKLRVTHHDHRQTRHCSMQLVESRGHGNTAEGRGALIWRCRIPHQQLSRMTLISCRARSVGRSTLPWRSIWMSLATRKGPRYRALIETTPEDLSGRTQYTSQRPVV